jgi:hypothetical protein
MIWASPKACGIRLFSIVDFRLLLEPEKYDDMLAAGGSIV